MRDSFPIVHEHWLVDRRTVGPFLTHSHLVVCRKTKKAVLVDACAEFNVLKSMVEEHDAELVYLLQTHAHLDHVGALTEMKEWSQAPIAIHREEMSLYEQLPMQCRLFGLPNMSSPPAPDVWLNEGDRLEVGELSFEVLSTPGHTPGGVTFRVGDELLFVGDSLFAGSIGRTDLPGGNLNQLLASIQQFRKLPSGIRVLPGHGNSTTLEREFQYNPFLQ